MATQDGSGAGGSPKQLITRRNDGAFDVVTDGGALNLSASSPIRITLSDVGDGQIKYNLSFETADKGGIIEFGGATESQILKYAILDGGEFGGAEIG